MKRNQRWTARILTVLMVIQMMLGPGPALLNNRTYAAAALPAGWSNQDIGSATAVGSADFSNGIYTIKGAGADIGGSSDSMQYVYQPVTGDCAIIARISSQQNTNSLAKAGVMIRDSLMANAKFAAALATPSKRVYYEWRTTAGGSASSSNVSATVPRYLKVQRKGTVVSAYQSSNGTTWSQVGSNRTVSLSSTVYVGLAVSSHIAGTLSQAVFDNVEIQYLTPPVVPANITATPANTSNTITWSAVSNASSYEIEVDGSVVSNGNNTSYIHNNLTPDTQHQYRVRAKNTGGTSAWSAYVASRTLPNPPAAPENLRVTSVNAATISIAWDASAGATSYDIEVDGAAADNGASMSYTHGNLQPSTQHTYKVRAKNAGGSSVWTSMMTASTLPNPPQVPANVVALATHSSITVSWEAASGADGYDIEADGTIIDNNTSTTYVHNDLTPDSQHIYRVRARNTGGMSDWSTAITQRTLPNVPVAPINIYTVPTKNEIQVNWDPVSGAEAYEIEVDGNVISNGANTSYTHANLQANTAHTYRVRSINAGGTGEWSVTRDESTLPDAPAVPVIVQSESTIATITITWAPVADAAGYDIEADGIIIDNGSSVSYTDINLQPNTQHHYRVRGRNAGGVGEWSEEVVKSTLLEVPGTPANVSASSTTTTITVTWDTVPNAVGYDIEVDGQVVDNGTNTSYTHMDLLPETLHVYRVRAKNDGGPGEWSTAIEKKTLQEMPGVPGNIAFAANSTSITITWDAVANAVGYDIEADGTIIDNGMETSYLHDGLTPNTQHTYRVRAKNPAGPGPWSNIETVSTVQETIGIPGNLSATASIDSISLTWNAVAGATGYDIEADGTIIDNGNTTSYTHTPLAANTVHSYRVRAKSAAVIGEWSETVAKSTLPVTPSVPEVPANLQATSATNTITLTWDAVTGATGYEVDADGTVVEATGTSYAHNNLQPNTSHTYKVRSKNAGGASAWSAAITKSTLPALPAVPTNVVATTSSDSITMTWDAVQGATGYEIEADGTVVGVAGTSYVHANLQTGSSHTYRVRTLNAGGAGAWSNPVTATIAPAMNTDLKAITDGDSNITVTWSPIEGATGYDIEVDGVIKDNGSNTSYVHTGLVANIVHTYRIRAKSPDGTGSWSNPVSKAVMTIIEGGTISQDTTWDNVGSPYVISSNVIVDQGCTLTVTEGTVIKGKRFSQITVNGRLVAIGTAENRITFMQDSSTYKWAGVYISTTGEFVADYIKLYNAGENRTFIDDNSIASYGELRLTNSEVSGYGSSAIAIHKSQGDVTLNNNTITGNNSVNAITIDQNGDGALVIRGNKITNNGGTGIDLNRYVGNAFTFENNTVTGNGAGAMRIYASNFLSSTYSSNVIKGTTYILGDTLSESLTLPKDEYILTGNLIIPEGKTLTVDPGTVIKGKRFSQITVNGRLVAIGTAENRITFMQDSSTYKWAGVYISTTGEFVADYIKLYNAGENRTFIDDNGIASYGELRLTNSEVSGYGSSAIAIHKSQGDVTLNNNTITNNNSVNAITIDQNGEGALVIEGNSITNNANNGIVINKSAGGALVIRGNNITNNSGTGIDINKYVGNAFTFENNTITGNGAGAMRIYASNFLSSTYSSNVIKGTTYILGDTLSASLTLPKDEYILTGNLIIPEGKTLTVDPGTVIKGKRFSQITVNGRLVAIGTAENRITFMKDSYAMNWAGVYISTTGEFVADYIKLYNAGDNITDVESNSITSYGDLRLTNSEVSGCRSSAIVIHSNIPGGTRILNNTFKDNSGYAIYTDTLTQPTIAYNTFQNNYYGIYNNQPTLIAINAQHNYWGSVYGPSWYLKELNQWIGYGEKVSEGVDFYNWLGQASQIESNYGKTYSPTGNHSYQSVDMSVKAPGYQLDFGRTYNSLDTQNNGLFGKGWTFSYECSIKTYTEAQTLGDGSQSQLTIVDVKQVSLPDGKKIKFKGTDATQYVAEDNRNKLAKTADGYELTTKDQYKYLFNANGYLYKITDRHNNIIDITVAANGKILQIKDSVGRVFTITYNTAGNIETIYDQFGHQITYQYDNGKLVKVIDPKLYETTYGYDAEGFLSVVKNKNHEIVEQVTYDHAAGVNQHKIKTLTDEYGNVKTYSHDTINYQVIITDSNGRQTIEKYDALKSITTVIDPETKQTVPTYNLENGVNKYNEIKSVKDRDGNTTTYDYDTRGNVTKITNPDGSFKLMEYDAKDNLIATCDESNYWIVYQYDANGVNVQKKAEAFAPGQKYAAGANDNNFKITSYDYFSNGLVKTITVKNGSDNYNISFTYDSYGNIDTITDSRGKITDENYNEVGWKTNTKSPLGFVTSYNYDNNGNLQTIQKSKDTAGSSFATTSFAYDAEGNKTKEVQPKQYVQASGAVGTRYTYYPSGEVNTVTDAEGNPTTYTYDLYGNVETETKPSGAIYRNEYDVMNRLVKVYFRANAGAPEKLLTENSYSVITGTPFNKTKKIEKQHLNDTEVAITEYTYDYAGRLIAQKNPDGTTKSAVFNKNGTLQTVTDEKGLVSKYSYDGLGNMTESWVPADNNGAVQYTYTKIEYDPAGRKTAEKVGQGRVAMDTAATSFIATKSYTYWPDGKTKTVSLNGKLIKEYSYDDDGNLNKEITYMAENDKIEVSYDNNYLGKPIKISKAARTGDFDGNDFADNSIVAIDTVLDYDDNGNLSYQKTPLGIETFYAYDNLNRQTEERKQVEDENGNLAEAKTTKTYTWDGQAKTITDARNNTTIYDYDSEGNLINVTDAKVGVTAYYYDLAGRRIAEVRPESNVSGKTLAEMNRTEYTYDLMDRIKLKTEKYVDSKTNQWVTVVVKAYKYDQFGKVIKELDALGYKTAAGTTPDEKINNGYGTEYTYTESGLTKTILDPETKAKGAQFTSKISYDTLDRKTDETNAKGVTTTYGYDDFGNIVSVKVKSSTTPEKTIQSASYDYTGNILSKTDGNGNTINYLYNALGEVRKAIYPGDSTIAEKTEQYQYDKDGNLKKQWDDTGKEVQYTYDRAGRQLSRKEQRQDGTEAISTSVRYDLNGNKRYSIDAKGNTTENTYDALNRLETVTITVSGKTKTTTYEYDKDGSLKKETDWLGNSYTYNYDPLDRLIEKKDATDKLIQRLEYNENGAQVKSFDALEHKTEYQYDKNNRLLATIDPKTHTTSQTYDLAGNISTKTDGRTNTTTYVYDELNRLQSVINAKTETTSFTYDMNGNMLTQENGRGYVTTMEYNVANKLVRRIDHGGRTGTPGSYTYDPDKTETYSYYADGSLKTKTDRNGVTTTYTYDIHGRLLSQVTDNIHISYTYDNNGNQLTMTDGTGTTTRTYDEQNRVLTKQVPLIGLSTYTYDIIENIPDGFVGENTLDPKGNTTLKVYDKNGRLKYVTADGKTTTYNYDDNDNRESVVYPDGSTETYTYELDNLLKTLVNKKAGGTIIDTYTYEYDGAHNLTSKVDAKGTTIYTYDALNRLETVAEPGGKNTVYTFDAAGNRQTEVTVSGANSTANTYYYNEQNRLAEINTKLNGTTIQTTGYTYDNNGNQLTSEVVDYIGGVAQAPKQTLNIYDKLNQLLATTTAGKTVTNKYNGDGLRVEKNSNGQTTRYLYEYDKVVLEVNEQDAQTAKNIYGTNLLVRSVNGQTAYYMYNGHGDVTVLLGTAGQELARYYYDAFGNVLESSGNINNPIRYAGYQYDSETGLYYLNARYYDSKIARFLTEDTYRGEANDPLSLNLYTYCHNEPLMYDDPTGHWDASKAQGKIDKTADLLKAYRGTWNNVKKREIIRQLAVVNNKTEKVAKRFAKNQAGYAEKVRLKLYIIKSSTREYDRNSGFKPLSPNDTGNKAYESMIKGGLDESYASRAAAGYRDATMMYNTTPDVVRSSPLGFFVSGYEIKTGKDFFRPDMKLSDTDRATSALSLVMTRIPGSKQALNELDAGIDALKWTGIRGRMRIDKYGLVSKFDNLSDSTLGSTDRFGNIKIQKGLRGQLFKETYRHELVHKFFSPKTGPFKDYRANVGMWGYEYSSILRYTEEAIAETYGSKSILKGLMFPLKTGYVTSENLLREGAVVGGSIYLGYRYTHNGVEEEY